MTGLPVADRAAVRRAVRRVLAVEKRAVAGVLGLRAAAAVAGLAVPWLLGAIVDTVTRDQGRASVDRLGFAIVGCVLAQALFTRFALYASHRLGERTIARLREDFVERTLGLPVGVVERAGVGDLATRSSVDVTTVGAAIREVVPLVVLSMLELLLLFGAIFLLDPVLGLAALAGLPSIVVGTRWYLRRAAPAYLAEGAATAEVTETLTTTAEGARAVEALRLGAERRRTGNAAVTRLWERRRATLALRSRFFPTVEASYAVPIAIVLVVGGVLLARDPGGRTVTLGAVVAAALYLQQAIMPLDMLLLWIEQAQRGIASFARVLGVGEVPAEKVGTVRDAGGRRLVARGVRFCYPGGREVLHGIDLDVRPGERLAIVGPSGAGKSTLARLVAGIEPPGDGEVTLGGVRVTDLDPAVRRRRIALVTQEHHLFIGTLRDNLAFAAPDASDDRLRAALAAVGAGWLDAWPDGLDTVVGDGGHRLGPADVQQVALARLVLADPHVLILDEATAALDPTTARRTERALAAVLAGRTVIAIAHRLNTAHDADRVAVLEDGRITELGSHPELLRSGGAYASLWRSWHG